MTRPCGCGGNSALNCNCVLVPGPGTSITGTGDPDDPYEITAGVAALTVADTTSIDLTLTGDGAPATPYNLSGVVRRDPASTNLLTVGPAGLAVSCPAVQDCVSTTLGDGLDWDAINRRINVIPSTDAGNIVIIGTDGGVYASATGVVPPAQPRARIGKVAAQSIPSGGSHVVLYDQVITDNGGLHTAVGRLTAPIAGGYTIGATLQFQSIPPNDGLRAAFLRLNGGTLIAADQNDAAIGATTILNLSTCIDLAAGQFVEVVVQQTDSGGPLQLLVSANSVPTFWMYYTTEGV